MQAGDAGREKATDKEEGTVLRLIEWMGLGADLGVPGIPPGLVDTGHGLRECPEIHTDADNPECCPNGVHWIGDVDYSFRNNKNAWSCSNASPDS